MVKLISNQKGAIAFLGQGKVRVRPYLLKTRSGGQVELTTCKRSEIGGEASETIEGSKKIVLDFANVESLDVLIEKLQDLREDLINQGE